MKQALVVGIDHYTSVSDLYGCVNDAHSVKSVLERNSDGSVNFETKLITGTGPSDLVRKTELRESLQGLFSSDADIALFYFAGHGYVDETGGYILASDSQDGNDGIPFNDIITYAHNSPVRNKIIVLDSCHSGSAGQAPRNTRTSELTDGLTILTASTADQYATEENGSGVFTTLFVDALSGGAGDLVGSVTPGSVYAYIDQSLGNWTMQRPVFKTNVKRFISLRTVEAPIPLSDLQRLPEFFPKPGFVFRLDPTFEPERTGNEENVPSPDPLNTARFAVLQRYNRVNLVKPVDAPHMWHAAMQSKACKLTVLGEHYRRLVADGRI